MLGHKTSFGKFKKIEIILCIFFDHKTLMLEINSKKRVGAEKTNIHAD